MQLTLSRVLALSSLTLASCFSPPFSASAEQRAPAGKHGYITGTGCPHSCRTVGLPHSVCRDWREGNICYVEDLTKPPGRAPLPQVPQVHNTPRPIDRPTLPGSSGGGSRPGAQECRNLYPSDIERPHIDIYKVKPTGNFFGDKLKVTGAVEGTCLVEAGAFEDGRLKTNIPIVTTREFRRYEFEAVVHADDEPEIRVYNTAGERAIIPVDTSSGGRDRDRRNRDDEDDYFGR